MVGFKNRSVRTGFGLDSRKKPRTRITQIRDNTEELAPLPCYCAVIRTVWATVEWIPGDPFGYFYSSIHISLQEVCQAETAGEDTGEGEQLAAEPQVIGRGGGGTYSSKKTIDCKQLGECGPCAGPKNAKVVDLVVNYYNEGTEDPDMPEWAKKIISASSGWIDPEKSKARIAKAILDFQNSPEGMDGAGGPYDSEGNMQCPSGDKPCGESD
tara:strand:- start:1657 stop:2292 length:636 start_codon:yes stop_codon:yes gene_type:complete